MKKSASTEITVQMFVHFLHHPKNKIKIDKREKVAINPTAFPLLLKKCSITYNEEVKKMLILFLTEPEKHNNHMDMIMEFVKVTKKSIKLKLDFVHTPTTVYVPYLE